MKVLFYMPKILPDFWVGELIDSQGFICLFRQRRAVHGCSGGLELAQVTSFWTCNIPVSPQYWNCNQPVSTDKLLSWEVPYGWGFCGELALASFWDWISGYRQRDSFPPQPPRPLNGCRKESGSCFCLEDLLGPGDWFLLPPQWPPDLLCNDCFWLAAPVLWFPA